MLLFILISFLIVSVLILYNSTKRDVLYLITLLVMSFFSFFFVCAFVFLCKSTILPQFTTSLTWITSTTTQSSVSDTLGILEELGVGSPKPAPAPQEVDPELIVELLAEALESLEDATAQLLDAYQAHGSALRKNPSKGVAREEYVLFEDLLKAEAAYQHAKAKLMLRLLLLGPFV